MKKLPPSKTLDETIAENMKNPIFAAHYVHELKRLGLKVLKKQGICPNCHGKGYCTCSW